MRFEGTVPPGCDIYRSTRQEIGNRLPPLNVILGMMRMRILCLSVVGAAALAACTGSQPQARTGRTSTTLLRTARDSRGWKTEVLATSSGWQVRVTVPGPLTVAAGCVSPVLPSVTGPGGSVIAVPDWREKALCVVANPPTVVPAGQKATFVVGVGFPLMTTLTSSEGARCVLGVAPCVERKASSGQYTVSGTLEVVASGNDSLLPFPAVTVSYTAA